MHRQSKSINRRQWLQGVTAFTTLALLSGVVSACGAAAGSSGDKVVKLEIGSDGDELAFDQSILVAPAGATVELIFHNRSHHHQHNWVLVNGGEAEAQAVYDAAVAAGAANNWLPPADTPILAQTTLVASGESVTITFQSPAQAGDYPYLCTFPGHFLAGMKGTLTLT